MKTPNNTTVYYAFRGPEILLCPGGGAEPLPYHPFPGREPGGDSRLIDSFPLRVECAALPGRTEPNARVLVLPPETEAPEGLTWTPLRGVLGALKPDEPLTACRALALANWRTTTRFCGRCGARQGDKPDETARLCPDCGLVTYPRLSPAILALVRKGNRVLLARNAAFHTGIFSVLAGFVEPGESFEECVAREVEEEVAVRVCNIRYLGSQPWPFPDSLMVAFQADWLSGELRPDGKEIAEAGWYGSEDHPPLPLPGSLSRRILDMALGGD